jgi:hypothetical protein
MPAFDASTSLAVLFGVANYERRDLFDSMPWVENNVVVLTELLTDPDLFGFAKDRVFPVIDPKNGAIAERLDQIREQQAGLDTLLVYYCGHGVVEGGRYFLTGSDAAKTAAQKLAFEEFEKIFLRINAQRKILILDSCFSGRAISGHLADANSILESNIDRLTSGEHQHVLVDKTRKGTYVLASADKDQPAKSANDSGDLTAFTDLFVKRLKTGFLHVDGERITINSIVEAVSADAVQLDIPKPVQSDKFGLGGWAFVGNAAVLKRKTLGASIAEEIRKDVERLIADVEKRLKAEISGVRSSVASLSPKSEALQSPAPKTESGSRATETFAKTEPLELRPVTRTLVQAYSILFLAPVLTLGGTLFIHEYAKRPEVSSPDVLVAKIILSAVYVLLLFILEAGHRLSVDLRFKHRSWLPSIVNSGLAIPILSLAKFLKITGVAWLFWAAIAGLILTWCFSWLAFFLAGSRFA